MGDALFPAHVPGPTGATRAPSLLMGGEGGEERGGREMVDFGGFFGWSLLMERRVHGRMNERIQ